jgi:diguanylate cyclase (GGDEF)-like protein
MATISFMARGYEPDGYPVESLALIGRSYNGPADPSGAPTRNQGDLSSMDRSTNTLAASAAALAHGGDLDQTLATLLGAAAGATDAAMAAAFLEDPDRPGLQLTASLGMSAEADRSFEAAVNDEGHPVAIAARELTASFGTTNASAEGKQLVDALLPLVVRHDGVDLGVGVLTFAWPAPHALNEADRAILQAIADLAAVAVDRARLGSLAAERSEWFERMAHTDPLTGLANTRTLGRVLELELARATRQGGEVSVALIDVDGLTGINEASGHEAGDDVLRAVATVLAESVRLVDTVARYGGDEFVLIAPGAAGMTVAQRVLDGVAGLAEQHGRRISVSVGMARFPTDGASSEELLASASAALLAARGEGPGRLAAAPLKAG